MDLSIIIISFNTKELVLDCLASLFRTIKERSFEVWLVDNNSTDKTVAAVKKKYPTVIAIENKENRGFAAANNQAFRHMKGRYALLLNSDTVLTDGAVNELYSFMETHPHMGMACGQLLNEDGSKQNSIANYPTMLSLVSNETLLRILMPRKFPSKKRDYKSPMPVESCIGACLMIRKKAMDDIGYFDERYFFFFEETDWAYRMKRGDWGVYFVPAAKIIHCQGKSVGHGIHSRILFYRSRYAFFKKWHPYSFPFFYSVILLRLLIEALFSLAGFLISFGFNSSIKRRLNVYVQLLAWHFSGCPEKKRNEDRIKC